jgi:hypothetical protein
MFQYISEDRKGNRTPGKKCKINYKRKEMKKTERKEKRNISQK